MLLFSLARAATAGDMYYFYISNVLVQDSNPKAFLDFTLNAKFKYLLQHTNVSRMLTIFI